MNHDDIIKHIPEITSVAKVAAASIPFTGIVKKMLGPAADEVAEMWRDRVRIYRYERQVRLLEKVETIAQAAGFTPQIVAPKILFPLLEGASFEDDENLHDMWAALLANAASPENAGKVRPSFIAALRQMSPDEAQILKWMYDHIFEWMKDPTKSDEVLAWKQHAARELGFLTSVLGEDPNIKREFWIALDGLLSLRLAVERYYERDKDQASLNIPRHIFLSSRGMAFMESITPPTNVKL